MRLLLSAALLASVGNAEEVPEADRYCADLRRIVAAARERPPFRSLETRREDQWLDGDTWCRRIAHEGVLWRCGIPISDSPEGRRAIAARVQSCLPEARRLEDDPEPAPEDRLRSGWTRFQLGKTEVQIQEHGGPGMHIGWYYTLAVVAPR
jgi:hypothetical protein